jgi:hypothetical protein
MKANRIVTVGMALAIVLLSVAGLGSAQEPVSQMEIGTRDVRSPAALGDQITYQGRLTDGDGPADGLYDFTFILRDASASPANIVGMPVDLDDVLVTDGLFTVQLDFGSGVFDGSPLWLQIGIKPWDSIVAAYDELLPWQPLTAAPYANFAHTIYRRTVVVKPGVDAQDSGSILLERLAEITDASADNPYLLKIEPGIYDIGAAVLQMKEYVDIEGSGVWVTKITGTGNSSSDTGTVWGSNNAELRNLTVHNTGDGLLWSTAIYNIASAPSLLNVRALASGGAEGNVGVRNENAIMVRMQDVTAIAYAGVYGAGVLNFTSSVTMIDTEAIARQADGLTYGIYNDSSSVTMKGVKAEADRASTDGWGIYNNDCSTLSMVDVAATASAANMAYGVQNENSSPVMEDVTAVASSDTTAYGVNNVDSTVGMTEVAASATGAFAAHGVYNDNSSVDIQHSSASATGEGANYGMYTGNSSSLSMMAVTASAESGSYAIGLSNDGSTAEGRSIVANASSNTGSSYGVYNYHTDSEFSDLTATAMGGGSTNVAVRNYECNPTFNNSTLYADGATNNYGIYNEAYTKVQFFVTINNSQITVLSPHVPIRNDSEFSTRVGASLIAGAAVVPNSGEIRCTGVYDEGYTNLYVGSCP